MDYHKGYFDFFPQARRSAGIIGHYKLDKSPFGMAYGLYRCWGGYVVSVFLPEVQTFLQDCLSLEYHFLNGVAAGKAVFQIGKTSRPTVIVGTYNCRVSVVFR